MAEKYFIAGTDTDVGKTLAAVGLLIKARQAGLTTAAIKPVAAGCLSTVDGLRNDDALQLQSACTIELSYEQVNPVALEPAVAPHIAAAKEGRQLSAERLAGFCRGILLRRADLTLVEGAGGWRAPLNKRETLADVARLLQLPIILVVAMRLGCLNHALLTAEAIRRDGLEVAGWIANARCEQMSCHAENVATLKSLIGAPLLGEIPFLQQPDPDQVAGNLSLKPLLSRTCFVQLMDAVFPCIQKS